MIAAKSAGWPAVDRWPARFHSSWRTVPAAVGAIAVAAAAARAHPALRPALGRAGRDRRHLGSPGAPCDSGRARADCAPARRRRRGDDHARRRHGLDRHHLRFPGPRRRSPGCCRCRSRFRPISWPTSTSIFSTRSDPCNRRCGRCSAGAPPPTIGFRTCVPSAEPSCVIGFVLYPYVYLAARAMFQTQGTLFTEPARMLGARTMDGGAAHHAAVGAARHCRRGGTRAARDAQRHRRQRVSRRADLDAVDLHHLAQSRQPSGRRADGLPHAADRRRIDRARALWPAARGRRRLGAGRPPCLSHHDLWARPDGSR